MSDTPTVDEIHAHLQRGRQGLAGVRLDYLEVAALLGVLERARSIQGDPNHPDLAAARFILTGSYGTLDPKTLDWVDAQPHVTGPVDLGDDPDGDADYF